MVASVRAGESLRSVARRFGVSLDTVQRWVQRAGDQRLDRVDWSDRPDGPRQSALRTPLVVEERILALRQQLRDESDLGEYGAVAIRDALTEEGLRPVPSVRTINRILERRGVFDAKRRPRNTPPPRGWYLPDVADGRSELDHFDVISGFVIVSGPEIEVLNTVSLHGGLVGSWPTLSANAKFAREMMIRHWMEHGLPRYAQFDNDTRFQGPHQYKDAVSSVMRQCLSLGVVPVFVPPREPGFQAGIESYNAQWQLKVWQRFHHESLQTLVEQSGRYTLAYCRRRTDRIESAPTRIAFPENWELDLQAHPVGKLIYIRRTTERSEVHLLGRAFTLDLPAYRLVRCEAELDEGRIRFFRLRRREPFHQPLIGEAEHELPRRRFNIRC